MKRWLIAMTTFVLVTAACTAGGGSSDAPSAIDTGSGASHAPVTLQMWGAWTGRELAAVQQDLRRVHAEVPVDHGQQRGRCERPEDHRLRSTPATRRTPCSRSRWTASGQFCASGAWQDLNPYIEQSGFDVSQFPPSVEAYTSFAGSRCAFPFLTDDYGLYYNTDMFKKAGISGPPKTLSELEEDAKKLTVFNSDGSIKVAGFVPWFGYYEFDTSRPWATSSARSGTTTTAPSSVVDSDPAMEEPCSNGSMTSSPTSTVAATSRRASDRLQRFVAGQGDEFSTAKTSRRVASAMNIDGEWRTALHRGRGPGPAVRDGAVPDARRPSRPVRAWIRSAARSSASRRDRRTPMRPGCSLSFMATDTATLVYMANNVRNVPTTIDVAELARPGRHAAVPDVPGHLPEPGFALQGAVGHRCGRPEHPGGVRGGLAGGRGDGSRRWALQASRSRSTISSRRRRSSERNVRRARPT